MSKIISKDGTSIAYEKAGQGPSVILVDGAMGHRGHFGCRALAKELSTDFTVVTYDRRGRGESTDTPPYALEREIEDIDALTEILKAPINVYGFSSGAVLALRAAAKLGSKFAKLAVLEPPFGDDNEQSKEAFQMDFNHLKELLKADRKSDAVSFFLKDMVPPEILEGMKQSPGWAAMVAVAPTLAYDYAVMGDGTLPTKIAAAVKIPTLILDGANSPEFKHIAANAMAGAMLNAKRMTFEGQTTSVPPKVLAPVLSGFFRD